jgi:hypothetical protein
VPGPGNLKAVVPGRKTTTAFLTPRTGRKEAYLVGRGQVPGPGNLKAVVPGRKSTTAFFNASHREERGGSVRDGAGARSREFESGGAREEKHHRLFNAPHWEERGVSDREGQVPGPGNLKAVVPGRKSTTAFLTPRTGRKEAYLIGRGQVPGPGNLKAVVPGRRSTTAFLTPHTGRIEAYLVGRGARPGPGEFESGNAREERHHRFVARPQGGGRELQFAQRQQGGASLPVSDHTGRRWRDPVGILSCRRRLRKRSSAGWRETGPDRPVHGCSAHPAHSAWCDRSGNGLRGMRFLLRQL